MQIYASNESLIHSTECDSACMTTDKPLYAVSDVIEQVVRYDIGTVITRSYDIISVYNADAYRITTTSNQIHLLSASQMIVNNPSFAISFSASENGVGSVQILIESLDANNGVLASKIFDIWMIADDNGVFVGTNGGESLYRYYEKYCSANSISILSDDAFEQFRSIEAISEGYVESSNVTTYSYDPSTLTVQGYVYWSDSNGNTHPAAGVNVTIFHESNVSVYLPVVPLFPAVTVQTNNNGFYSYVYPAGTVLPAGGARLKITAYASGDYAEVYESDATTVYSQTSTNAVAVTQLGVTVTQNLTVLNNSNVGNAFSIHQAMEMAGKYADSLSSTLFSAIDVRYPCDEALITGYVSNDNYIRINESDTYDWDVLQHEYGHYIESCLGFLANIPLSHSSHQNLGDIYGKPTAIKLAWQEGWATYFAISSQVESNAISLGISNVGDLIYNDIEPNYIIYNDIEACSFGSSSVDQTACKLGDANELVVTAVLYDLTDGRNESYDHVAIPEQTIWNLVDNNNCLILDALIDSILAIDLATSVKVYIGEILSEFGVSAKLLAPNMTGSTPVFTWYTQGGNTKMPNDKFRLVFCDTSYNVILTTDYILSSERESVLSYTLTSAQWNTICQSSSRVKCYIESYQTLPTVTEPYYSNAIDIIIN